MLSKKNTDLGSLDSTIGLAGKGHELHLSMSNASFASSLFRQGAKKVERGKSGPLPTDVLQEPHGLGRLLKFQAC